jgi:tryptophan 2,3-dioxygenase
MGDKNNGLTESTGGCPMHAVDEDPNVFSQDDLTYNDYLKVTELLQLQVAQSDPPHHDEMLFIVIHQTYELWFKQILHELESAISYMQEGRILRARHFVARCVAIMRVLVAQIHLLETMEPVEFLHFRHRLMPASGFQSIQFREMEFVCGLKDERYYGFFKNHPELLAQLKKRADSVDLRTAYYDMLREQGHDIPAVVNLKSLASDEAASGRLLDALRQIYQDPDSHLPTYLLTESLLSLDQELLLWRDHHVRVVERIIGFKRGTGGSSGVGYLQTTTSKKCFPFLWDVRSYLEEVHK